MEEKESVRHSPWLNGVFALFAAAVWSVVVVYAIHAGMRANPVVLPFEDTNVVRTFLPEGWRFFTKNAEEDNPLVFTRVGTEWVPAFGETPTSYRYLFGANRTGRYRGVELGIIGGALAKDAWKSCSTNPFGCLDEMAPVAMGPLTLRPTLCGELGMVRQPPVPWAWARSSRPVVMPSKVAKVIVSC